MTVDPTSIEGIGVSLRTAEWSDPRFSTAQERAITAAVKADPQAKLLGLDHNMRPVVAARLGIPARMRIYAIVRNGDPTEPTLEDTNADLGLKEVWHPRRPT